VQFCFVSGQAAKKTRVTMDQSVSALLTAIHLNSPLSLSEGLNNSLHGLLWNRPMTVLTSSGGSEAASLELEYKFNGSDAGYPFLLQIVISCVVQCF
jgi:hypothetical protein